MADSQGQVANGHPNGCGVRGSGRRGMGRPCSGIDGFPAVTVYAVDAAHVVGQRGHVIHVGCSVDLSARVEARIQALLLGNSVRVGKVHIHVLGFIHLTLVGEKDLWFRPAVISI